VSDYLLQCAASNWCVSSLLAAFAWFAQVKLKRPMIAHLLWLLVLVKLVTPPLLSLPLLPAPEVLPVVMAAAPVNEPVMVVDTAPVAAPIETTSILLGAWLLGSVIVLLWSSARIIRFHRLLTLASQPAPRDMRDRAAKLARQLGLKKTPSIHVTSARVTPMVWWLGGKVRIFIPADMPRELGPGKMRWILAHELAHVRRGDHYVRWLEWLACVAFWWNPVAWLARRNLRANEEVCCDALVLRSFEGKPHSYANSLLSAVEFLAAPGLRPPAMASEINSGGFLERRFRMIVSKTPIATTPRWLQAVLLVCTACVLPLGVAYAQNPDIGAVTKRLKRSVEAGEMSPTQARTMLRALKEQAAKEKKAKTKAKDREAEHYDRLVKSLKEGLREGIRSGKIDEEEAAKLYHRQMEYLQKGGSYQAKLRAKEQAARAAELQQRARDLEAVERAKLRSEYETVRRDYETMEAARRAEAEAKAKNKDLKRRVQWVQVKERQAEHNKMLTDLESAKRELAKRTEQLERMKVEIDKKQADMYAEIKDRAMQLRARQRDLEERQKQLEMVRATKRAIDFTQKKNNKKVADEVRKAHKLRQVEFDLAKKERDLWNVKLDLEKAKKAADARKDVQLQLQLEFHEAAKRAAEAKKKNSTKKPTLRWDTRKTKKVDLSKKPTLRWDTRVNKTKEVDASKETRATWKRQWNTAIDKQKAAELKKKANATATETMRVSLEAVRAARAKHEEQVARDRAAAAAKKAANTRVRFSLHKDRDATETKTVRELNDKMRKTELEWVRFRDVQKDKEAQARAAAETVARDKAAAAKSKAKRKRRSGIR